MARSELQTLMLMLDRIAQGQGYLATELAALRDFMADGLTISRLPELPAPSVSVPQTSVNVDTSEIAASVSHAVRESNAAIMEHLTVFSEGMQGLVKEVKNVGLNSGIRAVGSALLRAKGPTGAPIDVKADADGKILTNAVLESPDQVVDTRLDYDGRTDSNPVYVGKAPMGSGTSEAVWTITKLEYDASGRLVRSQVVENAVWHTRAGAF